MNSNPRMASQTKHEGGTDCPACRTSGQILQEVGGAGRASGPDGDRTLEVACYCLGCGAEWSPRYRLESTTIHAPFQPAAKAGSRELSVA
jgi:hypothetical protein